MTRNATSTFTLSKQALDAMRAGNTIEAIKLVRAASGMGLAEAKSVVELIQKQQLPPAQMSRPTARHGPLGLAPGEVGSGGGGAGKWLILFAAAAIAVIAALYL